MSELCMSVSCLLRHFSGGDFVEIDMFLLAELNDQLLLLIEC